MKDNILASLKASLVDTRSAGATITLEELLERKKYSGDIVTQYRLFNTDTETEVTSITDIISAMDKDKCTFVSISSDRISIHVIVDNIKVRWVNNCPEDRELRNQIGSGTKLLFGLNYMNDNDTTIPLKIVKVGLSGG